MTQPRPIVFLHASSLLALLAACGGAPSPEPPRNRPAVDLATGRDTSCAVLDDGTARCWGSDLGDPGLDLHERGAPPDRCILQADRPRFDATPRDVPGLRDAVEIAVGDRHACARTRDGSVRCWGRNYNGELGDGGHGGSGAAVTVHDLANVAQVAVGIGTSCARLGDGTVRCWGHNSFGEVGDGTGVERTTPSVVRGVNDARQIAVGMSHACALHATGEVSCWGGNVAGELGDGTTEMRFAPVRVAGLSDVVEIAAGSALSCARTRDGSVRCWGDFVVPDRPFTPTLAPTEVARGEDITAIRVGWSSLCVTRSAGTTECFGVVASASRGGPRPGTTTLLQSPSFVMPLAGATDVEIGQQSVCARDAAGAVQCIGQNVCGDLGDGTTTHRWASAAPVAL